MKLSFNLRVFIAACAGVILLVSILSAVFMLRLEKSEVKQISLSSIKGLFEAPTGSVYFMYSKNSPNDYVLYAKIFNMCKNKPQLECYYSLNDLYVDNYGCPRPNVISSGKYIVFIGGPISQPSVDYYEKSLQAPCSLEYNSTHIWWKSRNGSIIQKSVMELSKINEHHDVFIVEFFTDDYERGVFVCYGYGWRGTWIAVEYFCKVIYPNIEKYTDSFYIFEWIDLNDDKFPDVNEVFEEWLAGAYHSPMKRKANMLLGYYKKLGGEEK